MANGFKITEGEKEALKPLGMKPPDVPAIIRCDLCSGWSCQGLDAPHSSSSNIPVHIQIRGQFDSHQLASLPLSPRRRRTRRTRRRARARRTCKCCAAKLNPSPDVLAVRLTAAPLCRGGTRAAQLYHFSHTVCAASKKSTARLAPM